MFKTFRLLHSVFYVICIYCSVNCITVYVTISTYVNRWVMIIVQSKMF